MNWQERWLATEVLGLTEEQYAEWCAYRRDAARKGPQPAVVAEVGSGTLAVISLVSAVLSIGLTIAASFFKPQTQQRKRNDPARLKSKTTEGTILRNARRLAPTSSFQLSQEAAELGAPIPVVYAKRENIGGIEYGGVRIAMATLWSQLTSYGGSQMLRATFLLSEGPIKEIDPIGFAVGDTPFSTYGLSTAIDNQSRVTFYYRNNGGRLTSGDRIAGRSAGADEGNAQNAGGGDVFQVRSTGNSFAPAACSVIQASGRSQFGVYAPIGNDLAFRLNPRVRPQYTVYMRPEYDGDEYQGEQEVQCPLDLSASVERKKLGYIYSSRSGITNVTNVTDTNLVNVGGIVTYLLSQSTEAPHKIQPSTSDNPDDVHQFCNDVAAAVAGRQQTWDDAIIIGETYKIGSAWAVCISRSPSNQVFVQDQYSSKGVKEADGTSITARFRVTRAGRVFDATSPGLPLASAAADYLTQKGTNTTLRSTGTGKAQLMRVAFGSFSFNRPARVFEIGIKSRLGVQISGLLNVKDTISTAKADGRACRDFDGLRIEDGEVLKTDIFNSGTITSNSERYSFFKLIYRQAGSTGTYTALDPCFGIRGTGETILSNFIRIEMPSDGMYEFLFEPLSGWEIRSMSAAGDLEIIDSKLTTERNINVGNGINAYFRGFQLATDAARENHGTQTKFRITETERDDSLGGAIPPVEINDFSTRQYVDAYARLAEQFPYEEVRSSALSGPEHEIAYVNLIVTNPTTPTYPNMALMGMNLRSTLELQNLDQITSYVNQGVGVRTLYPAGTSNATHLFPEILWDQQTNPRYGSGLEISDEQIYLNPSPNAPGSYYDACVWCYSGRLFYDGPKLIGGDNWRDWASETAAFFLLEYVEVAGQSQLRTAWPGSIATPSAVSISGMFTAGNIVPGTFGLSIDPYEDRLPIQISVKWREERANSAPNQPGLFPVERQALVRESDAHGGSSNDPIEDLDLSQFCTTRQHAIYVAKYIIRRRRLGGHAVKFGIDYSVHTGSVGPGDYVRVVWDEIGDVDALLTGVVVDGGRLSTVTPWADGSYNVLAWAGSGSPTTTSVTVSNSGHSISGVSDGTILAKITSKVYSGIYQIRTITLGRTEDGQDQYTCEAVSIPVDSSYIPEIAKNFTGTTSDAYWTITG